MLCNRGIPFPSKTLKIIQFSFAHYTQSKKNFEQQFKQMVHLWTLNSKYFCSSKKKTYLYSQRMPMMILARLKLKLIFHLYFLTKNIGIWYAHIMTVLCKRKQLHLIILFFLWNRVVQYFEWDNIFPIVINMHVLTVSSL